MNVSKNPIGSQRTESKRKSFLIYLTLAVVFSLLFINLTMLFLKVYASPGNPGPCTPTRQTVTHQDIQITIHYPSPGSCTDEENPPYPAIVFAHGFSMFGLTNGMLMNEGNGEHLASWGYITAIPKLPDDFETRTGILLDILDFLEAENTDPDSFLYAMVDTVRFSTAGHSLGGATALAAAARDSRVKAVVGLDPVFHTGGPLTSGEMVWDAYLEAPDILVPTGILGAPSDPCNADNDSLELYPLIGARLKAHYLLVDASHLVFADPGNPFFSFFCGGSTDPFLTALSQKYMTAWFNYYLKNRFGDYRYLYGDSVRQDVQDGLVEIDINDYPGLVNLPLIIK